MMIVWAQQNDIWVGFVFAVGYIYQNEYSRILEAFSLHSQSLEYTRCELSNYFSMR